MGQGDPRASGPQLCTGFRRLMHPQVMEEPFLKTTGCQSLNFRAYLHSLKPLVLPRNILSPPSPCCQPLKLLQSLVPCSALRVSPFSQPSVPPPTVGSTNCALIPWLSLRGPCSWASPPAPLLHTKLHH